MLLLFIFVWLVNCFFYRDVESKVDDVSLDPIDDVYVNPWSKSVIEDILLEAQVSEYEGYHTSKVALSSLSKVIEIGGDKYQIGRLAGAGAFGEVYEGCIKSDPDKLVAVKIEKPLEKSLIPWEFYMYRQLEKRVPNDQRLFFGYAHGVHLYSDSNVLITNFLAHGTLLNAINLSKGMDEELCIYYTIEMLSMLESLHRNDIIHGDFKADNLMLRNARGDLMEDGFRARSGCWREQGLCLVDWGRGIDLQQFPNGTKFNANCGTPDYICIQMQEKKQWKYQV
ncbi:mitotic checkpoint serine/threonine-protein kinase BUB1-like [Rutidosis leptorrhynchoides]|uniref:mitotic checkpoint serine/threonine-protein kinase BUB1-like n=1 Tax=Rutidosis leptorrhynchoides TaxID=125765 RepID=UPI003A9A653D